MERTYCPQVDCLLLNCTVESWENLCPFVTCGSGASYSEMYGPISADPVEQALLNGVSEDYPSNTAANGCPRTSLLAGTVHFAGAILANNDCSSLRYLPFESRSFLATSFLGG